VVKVQHFPLTSLVVLTTLTLPCERDILGDEAFTFRCTVNATIVTTDNVSCSVLVYFFTSARMPI